MANGFAINPLQEPSRDFFPSVHEWPHSCGIKHEVEQVARAGARLQINKGAEEAWRRFIRSDYVPVTVQRECRVRLVLQQYPVDCLRDDRHLRSFPSGLVVGRSVTRSEQQDIPLAQRNVQLL